MDAKWMDGCKVHHTRPGSDVQERGGDRDCMMSCDFSLCTYCDNFLCLPDMRHIFPRVISHLAFCCHLKLNLDNSNNVNNKETKSVTTFNLFTFLCADLIHSKVEWKLSSASD